MGKKSRRQKQDKPAPLEHKLFDRFAAHKIHHKDGSLLTTDEVDRMTVMVRQARDAVEATQASWLNIEISWTRDQLEEYLAVVAYPRIRTKGLDSALRALERWPHLRPHWSRLRRRVCDYCHSQVALSEPRYLVCGGCGVARYCCEECQRNDWGWHQTKCTYMSRQRRIYEAEKLKVGQAIAREFRAWQNRGGPVRSGPVRGL